MVQWSSDPQCWMLSDKPSQHKTGLADEEEEVLVLAEMRKINNQKCQPPV